MASSMRSFYQACKRAAAALGSVAGSARPRRIFSGLRRPRAENLPCTPIARYATPDGWRASNASNVKQKIHHVAVVHHILFAFAAHFAGVFGALLPLWAM